MYQRQGKVAYKANLNNTLALAAYLKHPEHGFKSIHVAGTNGKGSASHMLASVLQEAGYTVGLYTSPHLKDFRERIKINGELISKRSVSSFVKKHKRFFEEQELSFFEMTVGLAFDYFRSKKVDIAIVEVGLGGRLDSTNILTPEISVITNIGLDHTQFLGTTLAEIASEKAGIMKQDVPVVIGETTSETKPVFQKFSEVKKAEIHFAEKEEFATYISDLKGKYQEKNLHTALTTIKVLKNRGWVISEAHMGKGFLNVMSNTGLQGRWQVLQEQPKIICDTAHNKEGLRYVIAQLLQEKYDTLHIVLGVVADKDLGTILPMFPAAAQYYFCNPNIARGLPAKELQKIASTYQLSGKSYQSVSKAFKKATQNATKKDVVFIGGSTFVVAEVL